MYLFIFNANAQFAVIIHHQHRCFTCKEKRKLKLLIGTANLYHFCTFEVRSPNLVWFCIFCVVSSFCLEDVGKNITIGMEG